DAKGQVAIPNGRNGIELICGPLTMIGNVGGGSEAVGALSPLGNLISGNMGNGLSISGLDASDIIIRGNFIGTTLAGDAALPNRGHGIFITQAATTVIGGPRADASAGLGAASNLISGNTLDGIRVLAGGPGLSIVGNFIGTDLTGTQ